MDFSNMTIRDFIGYIIKFDNVHDILKECRSTSEKGLIFERLYDIIIKTGFCDEFPRYKFTHLVGNVNTVRFKTLNSFDKYFQTKVYSIKTGGCSDITLLSLDGTYIFISSKYFDKKKTNDTKNKERKTIYCYDIQHIMAVIADNKHIYKKTKIYLVVRDKILL